MTRSFLSVPVVVLVAALLAPASAATAEPPTPYDPAPELFAETEACTFPISVVFTGKGGSIDLPNNPQFAGIDTSPGLQTTVTNLDTGDSVTVNTTGAFRYVEQPDGSTIVRASGHNFLYAEPGFGVTALATTGPIILTVSPEGDFVAADTSRARVRDLCAELSE